MKNAADTLHSRGKGRNQVTHRPIQALGINPLNFLSVDLEVAVLEDEIRCRVPSPMPGPGSDFFLKCVHDDE